MPCHRQHEVMTRLARRLAGRCVFVQIDVDSWPQIAARYSIESLPTISVLNGGRWVGAVVGYHDDEAMADLLTSWLRW
jgi:thioredoxin-like negative regulator of GroEL